MGLKKQAVQFPLQSPVDGRLLTHPATEGKRNLKGATREPLAAVSLAP